MTAVDLVGEASARVSRVAGGLPYVNVVRRHRRYRRTFGHGVPRGRPALFSDKVNWRILHDRRALLEGTCDKLAMKQYAQSLVPDLVRAPRTLWAGTDVAELARVELPEHWILKPNHASGVVHFGRGRPDAAQLERVTRGWLEMDLWRWRGEWAYRSAQRLLVVEEVIGVPGTPPEDLKVILTDGVPRLVQVHSERFTDLDKRAYTPEWEPRAWSADRGIGSPTPPPQQLGQMLQAASVLAAGFDMLRVDFYEHDGVLWFGELTPYPGGGLLRLDEGTNTELGRLWQLPEQTRGGQRLVPPAVVAAAA